MAKTYTGIDIGTSHIKVIIAGVPPSAEAPLQIIGTGVAVSKGMRHGYIVNVPDVTHSIEEAVLRATRAANVHVRSARIGISGVGLDELNSTGEVSLTASSGEVSERDLDRVLHESEKRASSKLTNRKVIHAFPLAYRIDGTTILGRPLGMKGTKLAVDALLVTAFEQHVQDMIHAVEAAHVEVEDVMASPLAASLVTLTKAQKIAGVALANIGSETVSIAIFENDIPVSIKVFPVGSSDITNDLALSFRIPLSEAEQMKRGAVTSTDLPRKKIDDIINDRLKHIFQLIDAHLKSIGKQRLLPAGIVITGGGSGIATASDIARATLRLPSHIGALPGGARAATADASWAVAYGLCRWGYAADQKDQARGFKDVFEGVREYVLRGIRSLLP